jgi:hypothetical protein
MLTYSCRLSPNQIQKLLNQYLVADYEQPINGEIMKAVASRVTEIITALETYTPSCRLSAAAFCESH